MGFDGDGLVAGLAGLVLIAFGAFGWKSRRNLLISTVAGVAALLIALRFFFMTFVAPGPGLILGIIAAGAATFANLQLLKTHK